jgi:hypothetical protein
LNSNKRENEREVLASLADVYCYTDTVIGRKKERKENGRSKMGCINGLAIIYLADVR